MQKVLLHAVFRLLIGHFTCEIVNFKLRNTGFIILFMFGCTLHAGKYFIWSHKQKSWMQGFVKLRNSGQRANTFRFPCEYCKRESNSGPYYHLNSSLIPVYIRQKIVDIRQAWLLNRFPKSNLQAFFYGGTHLYCEFGGYLSYIAYTYYGYTCL